MSKITINLNSVINTYCENRYDSLENRIRSACKRIFDYDYIEDAEAREKFELYFCTEYIDRNLYTPSVAVWELNLKAQLQSLAPVFNNKLRMLKVDIENIKEVTVTTGSASNTSKSSGSGTSKAKDIQSTYPQDLLSASDLSSVTRADLGSRSEGETSQSSENKTDGSSSSRTERTPNELELLLKYREVQEDLIRELVGQLHNLFLIVL